MPVRSVIPEMPITFLRSSNSVEEEDAASASAGVRTHTADTAARAAAGILMFMKYLLLFSD